MAAPFPSGRVGGVGFRARPLASLVLRETPWWADALALALALVGVTLVACALS